jgi:hypothetical protein
MRWRWAALLLASGLSGACAGAVHSRPIHWLPARPADPVYEWSVAFGLTARDPFREAAP